MRGVFEEHALEELAGVGLFDFGDLFWCSLRDDAATTVTTFRAEIDEPIGASDYIQVMLDDDQRVAI